MATKSSIQAIPNGTSLAAGATYTSSTLDLRAYDSAILQIQVQNGATAPTTAPTGQVFTSIDGTNWYLHATFTGNLAANGIANPWYDMRDTMYAYVSFSGSAGSAVTIQAFVSGNTALT